MKSFTPAPPSHLCCFCSVRRCCETSFCFLEEHLPFLMELCEPAGVIGQLPARRCRLIVSSDLGVRSDTITCESSVGGKRREGNCEGEKSYSVQYGLAASLWRTPNCCMPSGNLHCRILLLFLACVLWLTAGDRTCECGHHEQTSCCFRSSCSWNP